MPRSSCRPSSTRSSRTTASRPPKLRLEAWLAVTGVVLWAIAAISLLAGRGLAGYGRVGLYPLYGFAGLLGWALGNLYVVRRRPFGKPVRRRLLPVYLLAPPSVLALVWATAPLAQQQSVPLAPIWASAIFGIFFCVPVSFARGR